MSSLSQILANRANASLSTGPRTPAGKARSAANATTHGLSTAGFQLLPFEDPGEYRQLHDTLRTEYHPSGSHQDFLVTQMAESRWRLARIDRIENCIFLQLSGEFTDDPAAPIADSLISRSADPFSTVQRYRAAAERTYFKAHKELQASLKQKPEQPHIAPQPTRPPDAKLPPPPPPHVPENLALRL